MVTTKELLDKIYQIVVTTTDTLEHRANAKLNEATAYHDGYIAACEEFGRAVRVALIDEATQNVEEGEQ